MLQWFVFNFIFISIRTFSKKIMYWISTNNLHFIRFIPSIKSFVEYSITSVWNKFHVTFFLMKTRAAVYIMYYNILYHRVVKYYETSEKCRLHVWRCQIIEFTGADPYISRIYNIYIQKQPNPLMFPLGPFRS